MRVNPGDFRSCRRAKRRSFMSQPRNLSRRYFFRGWLYRNATGAGAEDERLATTVDLSLQLLAIGAYADERQLARHPSGTRFRFDIQPGIGRNRHFDAPGGSFQVHVTRNRRAQPGSNGSSRGAPHYFAIDVFEVEPASTGLHFRVASEIPNHDRSARRARFERPAAVD